MNNNLISREALAWEYLKLILNHSMDTDIFDFGLAVTNAIETAPAVDAVEVVHGRWVNRSKNQGWKDEEIGTVGMIDGEPLESCYCSECGEWLVASDEYPVKGNYCPNCGARMDGVSTASARGLPQGEKGKNNGL